MERLLVTGRLIAAGRAMVTQSGISVSTPKTRGREPATFLNYRRFRKVISRFASDYAGYHYGQLSSQLGARSSGTGSYPNMLETSAN